MLRIGYICPVYNAKELQRYTETALRSFFETTSNGVAIVVDDASAGWTSAYQKQLEGMVTNSQQEVVCYHFDVWGGLTRSWNYGLNLAKKLNLSHAIASNNDIVFTEDYYNGLLNGLAAGFSLVGPLSNAPGVTSPTGAQKIEKYVHDYQVTDDKEYLTQLARRLSKERAGKLVATNINGFFQFSSVANWFKGAYDSAHVYRPVNKTNSRGIRNPTPLITGNEDELQRRWHKNKMLSAAVCDSFIFHYRAVSRGDKHKKGNWYRQK